MSGRRNPIEVVGRFYENTNPERCCPICAKHKIIIVQKFASFYAMHTWLTSPSSPVYCIHTWRTREEDPPCLRLFKPTSHTIKSSVAFNQLAQSLKSRV